MHLNVTGCLSTNRLRIKKFDVPSTECAYAFCIVLRKKKVILSRFIVALVIVITEGYCVYLDVQPELLNIFQILRLSGAKKGVQISQTIKS
jgi:hypothetical protein